MSVDAPERIWAASVTDSYGEWQTVKDGLPRPVEYVRADKLEELAATLAEAKRENEALREALEFYADSKNWKQNGPLDPNSGNFTGGPARSALAHEDGR